MGYNVEIDNIKRQAERNFELSLDLYRNSVKTKGMSDDQFCCLKPELIKNVMFTFSEEERALTLDFMKESLFRAIISLPIKKVHLSFVDLKLSGGLSDLTRDLDKSLYGDFITDNHHLENLLDSLKKRMVNILEEYDDLQNYQVKNKTFKYPYEIVVVLDDLDKSNSYYSQFISLLKQGNKCGIYFWMMHPTNDPEASLPSIVDVLDYVQERFPNRDVLSYGYNYYERYFWKDKECRKAIFDYIQSEVYKKDVSNPMLFDDPVPQYEEYVYICVDKKSDSFASQLCEELEKLDIQYRTHCFSRFEGIQTIEKHISLIRQAKLFILLVNQNNYGSDYLQDHISISMCSQVDKPIAYLMDDIDVSSSIDFSRFSILRGSDYPSSLGLASYIYCMLENNFGSLVEDANNYRLSGNYEEAYNLYKRPSELGHAEAQYWFGVLHLEGKGVQKEETEGIKWITQSADQGNKSAQRRLYQIYSGQEELAPNYTEAIKWGLLFANGRNVDMDFWNVIPSESLYNESLSYLDNQNIDGAKTLLEIASKKGHQAAICRLAMVCYNNQDYGKALEWFKVAGVNGNAESLYYIGVLYEKGLCGKKDIDAAIEWYQKAADQNYSKAQERVDALKYEIQQREKKWKEELEKKKKERERKAREAQMKAELNKAVIMEPKSSIKPNGILNNIPKWLWIIICLIILSLIMMPFSNSDESHKKVDNSAIDTLINKNVESIEEANDKDNEFDNTSVDKYRATQKEIEEASERLKKEIEEAKKTVEKSNIGIEKSNNKAKKEKYMSPEEYQKKVDEENEKRIKEFHDAIYR